VGSIDAHELANLDQYSKLSRCQVIINSGLELKSKDELRKENINLFGFYRELNEFIVLLLICADCLELCYQ
jgi:hypothetical protein